MRYTEPSLSLVEQASSLPALGKSAWIRSVRMQSGLDLTTPLMMTALRMKSRQSDGKIWSTTTVFPPGLRTANAGPYHLSYTTTKSWTPATVASAVIRLHTISQ